MCRRGHTQLRVQPNPPREVGLITCNGNRDLLSLGWRRGLVVGTCTRSCHIEISLHLIVIRSAVDGRTWIAPRPLTSITVAPAAEPATCTSSTRHTGAGILGSALRNMVRMGRNNHKQSPLYHSLTPGTLVLVPSCRERTLAPLRYPGLEPNSFVIKMMRITWLSWSIGRR